MAPALTDGLVQLRGRQDVRHPAACPERRRVVTGLVGVRAPDAVAVTARVHERRVPLGERLGVEAEAAERAGPEVREEHVGRLEQLVQDRAALLVSEVERDERLPRLASAIDRLTPPLSVPIPWVMRPR